MTLDSGDNYPVTLTPTSITKESPTLKRQACHLIENNPTNITYFCEWIIKGERNYGFTRFRSIGHEFGLGQFDYGRCQIMQTMSFTPNKDELASIFYNKNLIGISSSGYWSSSVADAEKAWRLSMDAGYIIPRDKTENYNIRCVKR